MSAKRKGNQSFMMGVVTLLIAQIVVKFLGLFYRIFMTNMDGFGDVGNGLYSSGYQIYTLLLAVSSIGVPNAIAKLVSERIALGKNKEAHDVFKISMILFALFGGCASIILFIFSESIANLIGNSEIKGVMMALAPRYIFCVSIISYKRIFQWYV